ncbi:Sialidase precursor [Limihaloglobus sulfuriphilus]|uniref:exo-alpha-sialidase n=1 Tax=Limihaloglobus sulfuriphilus TaxID=1851148 RepID=A0A1Q2MCN9_9BACT|nr:sialidase family protein [Limihaloglobus sulfuriphilus]AQQ70473.1 Sialidase precursor [Limihaloglobus sulfuriphilus]
MLQDIDDIRNTFSYFWSKTLLCFVLFLLGTVLAKDISYHDVFVSGVGGYHTYRIPSVLYLGDGTLLAFCEGRKKSGSDTGDIDILIKQSRDSGKTWSSQKIIADNGADTIGNPCPVVDSETSRIFLFTTTNLAEDDGRAIRTGKSKDTRRVNLLYSDNNGNKWSKPQDITGQVKLPSWRWYATGPGTGIQLQKGPFKGRLIIPCNFSIIEKGEIIGGSHVIYSDDHGRSWQISETVKPGFSECQVAELSSGRLMLNMRNSGRKGSRGIAFSDDGGTTWPLVEYKSVLIEPVCQASTISMADPVTGKTVLLFSNPASAVYRERFRMTVRASFDQGNTWPCDILVHSGPSAYSCLVDMEDGYIGCMYEGGVKSKYEKIIFARLRYSLLVAQQN